MLDAVYVGAAHSGAGACRVQCKARFLAVSGEEPAVVFLYAIAGFDPVFMA